MWNELDRNGKDGFLASRLSASSYRTNPELTQLVFKGQLEANLNKLPLYAQIIYALGENEGVMVSNKVLKDRIVLSSDNVFDHRVMDARRYLDQSGSKYQIYSWIGHRAQVFSERNKVENGLLINWDRIEEAQPDYRVRDLLKFALTGQAGSQRSVDYGIITPFTETQTIIVGASSLAYPEPASYEDLIRQIWLDKKIMRGEDIRKAADGLFVHASRANDSMSLRFGNRYRIASVRNIGYRIDVT